MILQLLLQFALAGEIQVGVNGMVCSFCANGIEKKFKAEKAVDTVTVDLDKKQVVIKTKEGMDLSDSELKDLITKSGYVVTTIERRK
jgi:copper chaperone CopZ